MKNAMTVLAVLLFMNHSLRAQETSSKTADSSAPKTSVKSYFAAGLSYLSNSVYNGRKDSLTTPYLTPSIGYYHRSGLFASASASYLSRSGSSRIDVFNIEAGYAFDLGNFDGEIAAGKSFYSASSTNVSSEIKGSLSFSGGYDFNFIRPTVDGGIDFGTYNDYQLTFGLEHSFYAAKDLFQITPTVTGSGSTQNYYETYYNKRKVGGRKRNAGVVYDVSAAVENASHFRMLDYTMSLPMSYRVHRCTFIFSPAYVVPVNPAQIVVQLKPESGGNSITKTSSETISPSFYCSFGLSYKL